MIEFGHSQDPSEMLEVVVIGDRATEIGLYKLGSYDVLARNHCQETDVQLFVVKVERKLKCIILVV